MVKKRNIEDNVKKMILEQLMEKKDLLIYIDLRIRQLKEQRNKTINETENKKKAMIWERFNGRILELMNIKDLIHNNGIKSKCKYLWEKYGNTPKIESVFKHFPNSKKDDDLDAITIPLDIIKKNSDVKN